MLFPAFRAGTENKSMNGRILLFSMILVAANVASAAKYERTLEGNTKIQSSAPQQRLKASWSGDRDENGYATGAGTLTWFRMQKTWETGSLLPSVKYIEVSQYSGKMVEGKLEGSVVSTDTNGNTYHAKFEDGRKTTAWVAGSGSSSKKRSEESGSRPKVVEAPAEPPPPAEAPPPAPKIEHHVAEKQPSPVPVTEKQSSPAAAKEVSATHTADPAATPERTEESLRSLAMPPSSLRIASLNSTPPPVPESGATETAKSVEPADAPASPSVSVNDDDARAVAALDSEYQSAVKTNDAATIDRILADDFTLVRSAGRNVSKSELVKQARDKQAKYERHEVEDGTQKVRVWHDTAVVTETVWIKGIEDGKPVDEKMSLTATYARTPNGWRYVAAQASSPAK